MKFIPTELPEVLLLEPQVFGDSRGYFMELFRANVFSEHGPETSYVQISESQSKHGVLRGLHYQMPPYAQTKVVRVVQGCVLDVAVDVRKDSPTFGKHVSFELSSENKRMALIPRGFAHGFSVLSDTAIINYMVDNYYAPDAERGIVYNDPALGIDWKLDPSIVEQSAKDAVYPVLSEAEVFETGEGLYD